MVGHVPAGSGLVRQGIFFMKRFIITLTKKEHTELKLFAFLTERSMNQIIKKLIARFLIDKKQELEELKKDLPNLNRETDE